MNVEVREYIKRHCSPSVYGLLRVAYNRRKRTLSQFGQDAWVFGEAFNGHRCGFFLDVGAADGISASNTFLLERRYDWSGLCIEANPDNFSELIHTRRGTCLCVCIDTDDGEVSFAKRGLYSGIVGDDTDNPAGWGDPVIKIKTRSLVSVLRDHAAPKTIDYCSVDTEGAEDRVLLGFPFHEFSFKCLTIERPSVALREQLAENGYRLVREIPGYDVFYIHESFREEYSRNAFEFWKRQSREGKA